MDTFLSFFLLAFWRFDVVGRVCVTKISSGMGGGGWTVLGIQWGGVLEGRKSVGRSVGRLWARPVSPLFRDGIAERGAGGLSYLLRLGRVSRTRIDKHSLLSFVWGRQGAFGSVGWYGWVEYCRVEYITQHGAGGSEGVVYIWMGSALGGGGGGGCCLFLNGRVESPCRDGGATDEGYLSCWKHPTQTHLYNRD
ncbi:hypothetical protein QBC39DRAFT_184064 [Podospora conica]|nr:hypothetical protein QBC39DRAFT_184064 [Schizothecium conicum]